MTQENIKIRCIESQYITEDIVVGGLLNYNQLLIFGDTNKDLSNWAKWYSPNKRIMFADLTGNIASFFLYQVKENKEYIVQYLFLLWEKVIKRPILEKDP